jgi:hypothetical protein
MANEFVARKGLISSGSINVSGSVTASFFKGDGSQLTNLSALSSSVNIDTYTFAGDGTTKAFVLSQSYNATSLLVSVDGLLQTNTTDYTAAVPLLQTNTTITFIDAPPSASNILVKAFVNVTQNMTGSFSGSFLGIVTSASYATTSSYATNALYVLSSAFTGSFTGSHYGDGSNLIFTTVNTSQNSDSSLVIGNNFNNYSYRQTTTFRNGDVVVSGSTTITPDGVLVLQPRTTPVSSVPGTLFFSSSGELYIATA